MAEVVPTGELGVLSGVLFDLGVSSPQLDRSERGFSYRQDGPLDMRMDPTSGPTAADIVNTWSVDDLSALFAANGEGRFARRIARAIVASRPFTTTEEFAETVRTAIPAAARRHGGHPARRVFQAVRIAVNDELDLLAEAVPTAIDILAPRGRCVAICGIKVSDDAGKSAVAEGETAVDTDQDGTIAKAVEEAVAKATAPSEGRITQAEERAAKAEQRVDQLEKLIKSTPVPGGPVLSANARPQGAASGSDDKAAKAALMRQKADEAVSPSDAAGYRAYARQLDEEAAAAAKTA